MKTLIIFGLCSLMAMQTHGQTPNFLFSLKATNAQGYKDSVVIGTYTGTYPNHTSENLIPGFDGSNLTAVPADSNMDLRIAFASILDGKTDKRIIPSQCLKPMMSPLSPLVQVFIYIYAKKWPVMLNWDSTLFANTYCVNKSFFSRSRPGSGPEPDSINPENYPYAPIYMAALHGNLKLDSIAPFNPWIGFVDNNDISLNNGKQGKYYSISLYLNRRLGGGPSAIRPKSQFSLKIFPNPVDNQFTIEHNLVQGKIMIVKIFNIQGQMVDSRSISRVAGIHTIMTGHLPAGMYMVEMQESGGVVSRATFVKL